MSAVLFFAACGFVLVAVFTEDGVWALPAGALLVVWGVLAALRLVPVHGDTETRSRGVPWMILLGLAGVGVGLEDLHPEGPWSVLVLPVAVLLGLAAAAQTITGRGWWIDALRDSERVPSFLARPVMFFAVVMMAFVVVWSLGLVDFS